MVTASTKSGSSSTIKIFFAIFFLLLLQRAWSIGHRVENFYSLLSAYVGCGLGSKPAALAISTTFSSHSIAMI
jgi:hypothetical protein